MEERWPVHDSARGVIQGEYGAMQRQVFGPAGAVGLGHFQQCVAIGAQALEVFFGRLKAEIFPLNHVPFMFASRVQVKLAFLVIALPFRYVAT